MSTSRGSRLDSSCKPDIRVRVIHAGWWAVFSPEGEGVPELFEFFELFELGGGAALAPNGNEG